MFAAAMPGAARGAYPPVYGLHARPTMMPPNMSTSGMPGALPYSFMQYYVPVVQQNGAAGFTPMPAMPPFVYWGGLPFPSMPLQQHSASGGDAGNSTAAAQDSNRQQQPQSQSH